MQRPIWLSPHMTICSGCVLALLLVIACQKEPPPRKKDAEQQEIAQALRELERTKPKTTQNAEVALEDLPPIPQIVLDEDLKPTNVAVEPATAVEIREFRVGQPTVAINAQQAETVSGPLAQLQNLCSTASSACDGRTLRNDACVRDLPTCTEMPGGADDTPCCPEQCLQEYAALRRNGKSIQDATDEVFGTTPHPCLTHFATEMGVPSPAVMDQNLENTPEQQAQTDTPPAAQPPGPGPPSTPPKIMVDKVRTYVQQGINGVPRLVQMARDSSDPDAPRALLGLAEIGGPAGRAALQDIAESNPAQVDPMLIEAAKSLLERATAAEEAPTTNEEAERL